MEDFTTAEVGQKLYSLVNGEVEVTRIKKYYGNYPIEVVDKQGEWQAYTRDGRYLTAGEVCLFWSKPEIKAPKRKKTFWVAGCFDRDVVFIRGSGDKAILYETKEEAMDSVFTIAFVAPVEMEV